MGGEWRHARKRWGFGGFEKRLVVELSRVLASEEDGWLSELAEALRRVLHVVGAGGKVCRERLCLSLPHVEKPFNWKVIKSFVPELRSRKVFRVSGFLCYVYVRYEHSMYISRIHVWLCYMWDHSSVWKRMNPGSINFFYRQTIRLKIIYI